MAQLVRQRTNNLDTLKICGFETRAYPYTFFPFFQSLQAKKCHTRNSFQNQT